MDNQCISLALGVYIFRTQSYEPVDVVNTGTVVTFHKMTNFGNLRASWETQTHNSTTLTAIGYHVNV